MQRIKVHRMAKRFRSRSQSWKIGNILSLSLVGFVWYTLVSRRGPSEDKASLIRTIQGIKPPKSEAIRHIDDHEPTKEKQLFPAQKETNMKQEFDSENDKKVSKEIKTSSNKENMPDEKQEIDSKNNKKAPKKIEENLDEENIPDIVDPFNRKGLNVDTKLKLAERLPVEAPGRKTRPKLGGHLTPAPMQTNIPIILVWKAMEYQMKHYKDHFEFYFEKECGGCRLTTDRSLIKESAAVVHFNSPDLRKLMDVPDPSTRNPNQIYAFWSRETPSKTHHFGNLLQDERFDSIFNVTINFRRDADIVDYFGNVEYELRFFKEKSTDSPGWFERSLKKKKGLAVWAVSNCNSTYGASERMKYAQSLIDAGLDVTTFGTCFGKRSSGADLMQELMHHKFYLSLENSVHCPDYVSEKFWRNGLRAGAVPIVWGPTKEDVIQIAPKHSYIHSEDFETPEKLVAHLKYLDKNDKAYMEYHAWRYNDIDDSIPYEDIIPTYRSSMCRLCKLVTKKPLIHKTIPSIYKWLYETRYKDDLCFK